MLLKFELPKSATTSCKNVETKKLRRKNYLSCFKSLLVTGLWDIIMISLLPLIQSCSLKLWALSCIATNFHKGRRRDHKHKITDWPFKPKYGAVSPVLLQLVVAWVTFLFNAIKAISKGFAVVPAFRCDSFTTISHDSCGEYPCSHQWQINLKYFLSNLVSATGNSRRKKQKSSPIIGFSLRSIPAEFNGV